MKFSDVIECRSIVGLTVLVAVLAAALSVSGGDVASAQQPPQPPRLARATKTCQATIEINLSDGRSIPWQAVGIMRFELEDTGAFQGTVTRRDSGVILGGDVVSNAAIRVVGQTLNNSISFTAEAGDMVVFGVGSAQRDITTCPGMLQGLMGGTATGSLPGLRGDWLATGDPCVPIRTATGSIERVCPRINLHPTTGYAIRTTPGETSASLRAA